MIEIKKILSDKVRSVISEWDAPDIYAISFLVYSNMEYRYREFENVPSFEVSYNTESFCQHAGPYDEERWNYAFWMQDGTEIIQPGKQNKWTDLLFDWYAENGITNIGEECEPQYDERCRFIGKGPVGHYELLSIVADIARELQEEGVIEKQFRKRIPIIIHGLEYAWFDIEATEKANPHGEAKIFLEWAKLVGIIP